MVEHGQTFYDVLGVDTSADVQEIERAYREQVRRYHPDRPGGDHDQMRRINKAKEILTDPLERNRYHRLGHDGYIEHVRPAGWTIASNQTDDKSEPRDDRTEEFTTADTISDGESEPESRRPETDYDPNSLGGTDESEQRRRRGATAGTGPGETAERVSTDSSATTSETDASATASEPTQTTNRTVDPSNSTTTAQTGGTDSHTDSTGPRPGDETADNTDTVTQQDESPTETASDSDTGADAADSSFEWASPESREPATGKQPSESAAPTDSTTVAQREDGPEEPTQTETVSKPSGLGDPAESRENKTTVSTEGSDATATEEPDRTQTTHTETDSCSEQTTRSRGKRRPSKGSSPHRSDSDSHTEASSTLGSRSDRTQTSTGDESSSASDGRQSSPAQEEVAAVLASLWSSLVTVLDQLALGTQLRRVSETVATAVVESEHVPSRADIGAALRGSQTIEYIATARPYNYAVPRTVLSVACLVGLVTTFEVAAGSRPGLLTLGAFMLVSAGVATIRESSQLLFDDEDSRQPIGAEPQCATWSEDRLVQTAIAGIVGVMLFVLGFALSGGAIVGASLSILFRIAGAMAFFGVGGAFAAKTIDRSPSKGAIALGLVYVVPATLFVPPDRWLLGGGLPGSDGSLWFPVVSLGPIQVGQFLNVLFAVTMVCALAVPLVAFGGVFSTLLRRDVLDRGYTFQPLSWELGALGPAVLGTALVLGPPTSIGPLTVADAGQTVLLWSLTVWPTVFLGCYALARLNQDGRLPDLPDKITSVMNG